MVDYKFDADGFWSYEEVNEADKLYIPLPDGPSVEIEQLPVNVSKKTLGIWTNPAGDCDMQLEVLKSASSTWTSRLETGRLPAKWAWVSYFNQLWTKLRYGLGINASPVEDLLRQEVE